MPSVCTRTRRHFPAAGTFPGPFPRLVSLTGFAWRCLPCALPFIIAAPGSPPGTPQPLLHRAALPRFRGAGRCPIMAEDTVSQPNVRDAAVLLLSLGEQAAADVLKHLGPKDIQRVGAAMSAVGPLTVDQVSDTLSVFLNEVQVRSAAGASDER